MNRPFRLFLILLIGLGALACVWVGAVRWRAEAGQRRVEIVADWIQVQQLALLSSRPMEQILGDLRAHGVGGMAVSEDTIAGLRDDGFLTIEAQPTPGGGVRTLISSFDQGLLDRVHEHLSHKLFLKAPLQATRTPEGNPALVWPGSFEQIRSINVGLPPAEVKRLRDAGFDVVARIVNYPTADPANIAWSLRNLSGMGIRKVIFGGEEVLGFDAEVKETARLLEQEGLTYGSVEFSKQRGDEDLSVALKGDYLRVHSITPAEMTKLKPEEMIERYVRAAEERNVRLAFVRFLPFVTAQGWQDQVALLDAIGSGLHKSGLTLGPAAVYPPLPVPASARWIAGVGAAAAAAWLLALVFPLSAASAFLILTAAIVLHLGLLVGTQQIGRKLVALEAAIVFPSLALVGLYRFLRRRVADEQSFPPLGVFLATSAFSLLGALYVVGLLSSREYMVKAQQFMGIKAAHFLPLVLLAAVIGLDFVADGRTWAEMAAAAKRRLTDGFSERVRIWQILAGIVGLAALALLLLRTGNDPGVGVSPLEMRFRAVLDRILYVRPRTKEFLIGHPVLLLALMWTASQMRWKASSAPRWALGPGGRAVLLLVGAIGQVSMVNTFCHIHTPLAISVIRILNGLWVGGLLGWIVYQLLPKRAAAVPAEREIPMGAPGR